MMRCRLLMFLLLAIGMGPCFGQTLQVTANPPTLSISTGAELANGTQVSHQTLNIINPLLGIVAVDLYVRISGNLSSGTNSIPAAAIGVLVTSPVATPDPERMLTTINQRLLVYQPPLIGLFSTPVTLRYRVIGGSDLFKPAGTYSATITYTLTND